MLPCGAMRSRSWLTILVGLVCLAPAVLQAQNNLVLNGGTMTLGGVRRYDNVCLINGAVLTVEAYNASSTNLTKKRDTGNLELIAGSVYIDSTSKIVARGKGYQPGLCSAGDSPTATGGGRGGCSVMDSGGGGAHFGRGGRGTVDNPLSTSNAWQNGFPTAFEDDCKNDFVPASGSTAATCALNNNSRTLCWKGFLNPPNDDGAGCASPPCVGATVAGQAYWHNIYEPEFGAAGGDKGCRDGDGRSGNPMAGAGGGRVVLVGLAARNTASNASPCGLAQGVVRIDGSIDANGKRGCGVGNDSAGGGAGGSVLIVGEEVQVGASASISAAGGLGGDTFGTVGAPAYADCPAGAQYGGTCDDCGGGGGGGIISVLSVHSALDPHAEFDVGGEVGGTCSICNGEAGGGAGELQLDGAYVGEYCDGFDNDFDGVTDDMEDFGTQSCGLGSCAKDIAACSNGVPVTCVPDISGGNACLAPAQDGRPRIAVIIDTSASMLLDLQGHPTFGDGGDAHRGLDTSGDGMPNDSRLFLAREALGQVLSAYPEIDFSLARYHQDQGPKRSCQTAKWFECQGLVASYDDPAGNTGSKMCDVSLGPDVTPMTVAVNEEPAPTDSECINYAGSCGPPRRGADVLSGFGTPVRDIVRWMDGKESAFDPSASPGDICLHSQGKDCELRGSGPTPLAGALQAVEDYVAPIRKVDSAAQPSAMFPDGCRDYNVILVTDGAESCNGDPVQAAGNLLANKIKTNVVAVSVLPEERASLNAIAAAGGTTSATFVTQPEQLVPALTAIIADSIRYELCNGLDDDCDGKIDEDFPGLGAACTDDKKGICRS